MRKGLYLNSDKAVVADQFHEYFETIETSAGQSEMIVTNQIYVHNEFQLNENFQEMAVQKFRAGVDSVDFRKQNDTIKLINDFTIEKTKGKINNIVTPNILDSSTVVFLLNSIYLKGIWLKRFPLRGTRKRKFYISEMETVDVDFMWMLSDVWHTSVDELNVTALRLDYAKFFIYNNSTEQTNRNVFVRSSVTKC